MDINDMNLNIVYSNANNGEQILGLQPRDKAAMLRVNTIEFFFEEFT